MDKRVAIDEAKAKFSAIVDDVQHDWARYIIEREGRPVAAIVPMADLYLAGTQRPGGQRPKGALALLGAWGDVTDEEIDEFLRDVYAARQRDTGRRVELPAELEE
jgi:prevent-host-death family protein